MRFDKSLSDPEGIRTPDRLLRRQMLYPAELPDPVAPADTLPELIFFSPG